MKINLLSGKRSVTWWGETFDCLNRFKSINMNFWFLPSLLLIFFSGPSPQQSSKSNLNWKFYIFCQTVSTLRRTVWKVPKLHFLQKNIFLWLFNENWCGFSLLCIPQKENYPKKFILSDEERFREHFHEISHLTLFDGKQTFSSLKLFSKTH